MSTPRSIRGSIEVRRADERGHARHGWLESRHTFSFADYYDPRFMGYRGLRVINEDRVVPGAGFPQHGHRDMEIISYVVAGGLAHHDTLGTGSTIRPNELQIMSAGSGIQHSEMNASPTEPVHFLQMWVQPARRGTTPSYQQRDFGPEGGVRLLASPTGRDDSLVIGQDVDLYRVRLSAGQSERVALRHRGGWLQVISGSLTADGERLSAGDGAALAGIDELNLTTQDQVEALLYDLPEQE